MKLNHEIISLTFSESIEKKKHDMKIDCMKFECLSRDATSKFDTFETILTMFGLDDSTVKPEPDCLKEECRKTIF